MLANIWKKVLLIIVVLACLFNIVNKFVFHPTTQQELEATATYINEQSKQE